MRELGRLDAVVFDAGGTLVRLDFEWMSELLAGLGHPVDPIRLRRAEVEGRRRYDASAGRSPDPLAPPPPLGSSGDTRAYFGGMLEAAGVPRELIPPALERFQARHAEEGLWSRPAEGAREALDRIQALGLKRAVVSNSDGRAEQHLVESSVREGLELIVDSYDVRVEKPDPRIFAIALERLHVHAEHALYVGDIVSVDVRGARAAGMHVVLIDPYRDYAPRGVPAIPHLGALPYFIAEKFDIGTRPATRPPSRDKPTVPTPLEGVHS